MLNKKKNDSYLETTAMFKKNQEKPEWIEGLERHVSSKQVTLKAIQDIAQGSLTCQNEWRYQLKLLLQERHQDELTSLARIIEKLINGGHEWNLFI